MFLPFHSYSALPRQVLDHCHRYDDDTISWGCGTNGISLASFPGLYHFQCPVIKYRGGGKPERSRHSPLHQIERRSTHNIMRSQTKNTETLHCNVRVSNSWRPGSLQIKGVLIQLIVQDNVWIIEAMHHLAQCVYLLSAWYRCTMTRSHKSSLAQ